LCGAAARQDEAVTRIDDATLQAIEDELGTDGVWVAPELRNQVSPADEAKIEKAVAQATTPTYVTLVDLDSGDPLTNGDAEQLAGVIRDDTGRSGLYIGLDLQIGDDPYTLELNSFPEDYGLFYAARVAAVEHPDDLAAQTLRVLDLMESGDAEQLYDDLTPEQRDQVSGAGSSGSGEDGGGLGVGPVSAIVALVALVVAGVVLARRRRPRALSAPTATGAAFTLPPAVLSTVRAAEDQRTESQAQHDALALGEAIDAAELDPRRSQALPAWQAALDHYDVARRILDRDHSPADAVGAIVLARRGRSALAAAVRGRGWQPTPSCYFNPLHEGATRPVRWEDGRSGVRVPACAACAVDIGAGREPDDVLDFVADGSPAHYFKLDLGAWSETGYGALDTDLLGELVRTGRRSRS
jgi:hypothetical protein